MSTVRVYPDPHHVAVEESGEPIPRVMMEVSRERADFLLSQGRKGGAPDGEPLGPAFWLEPQAPAWDDQGPPNYLAAGESGAKPKPATVKDLRATAEALGLTLAKSVKKDELEAAIAAAQAPPEPPADGGDQQPEGPADEAGSSDSEA